MTNIQTPVAQAQQMAPTSQGQRFTEMVMKEFQSLNPVGQLTDFQKRIATSYFVKLDQVLKAAEVKNLAKAPDRRDLSYTWENVNLNKLAMDVVAFSAIGLDPLQPNHLNLIPYKNNSTSKYDIGFIIGYNGLELKAKKYGLDVPTGVTIELVYANDGFKQIKKDFNNKVESYIFEIKDDFDRGEIKGGFIYFQYANPEQNRIRVLTKADIEKRKPKYASAEFWGGEKDVWKNGQRTGEKEKIEGWYEEMAYKTLVRAAWSSITIDSQKIDENYQRMLLSEADLKDEKVQQTIEEFANKEELGFEDAQVVTEQQKQIEQPPVLNTAPQAQQVANPQTVNQPSF